MDSRENECVKCLGRTGNRLLLIQYTKDLNEFREADLVLVNVVREVHVLKEHIPEKPLVSSSNRSGTDTRVTISLKIVLIDWGEQQVDGVDVESTTTKGERNDSSVGAWDDVTVLTAVL